MTVLICILMYLIPLIVGCYWVYKDMNPGETVEHYIYRKDLEDVFWVAFVPGLNILCLGLLIISIAICYIGQLKKPYDSKNTEN